MTVRDIRELWNSNKEVRIYQDENDLFIGDLQDLEDDTYLDLIIDGIYDGIYENGNDIDISVL